MISTTSDSPVPLSGASLACLGCDATFPVGAMVHCPTCQRDAFLRSRYDASGLELRGPEAEFASYGAWLPFEVPDALPPLRTGAVSAPALARALGIDELWFAISGWAPHHGANLPTCTFKTLEAVGVMLRMAQQSNKMLMLPSAGNAGCGVLEFGSRWNIPAIVIVSESALPALKISVERGDRAPLLICLEGAAYSDAISMVKRMVARFGDDVAREGGAFNVARRDAMGVPVLRACQAIGGIPEHYFQGVGSGTGGIAAHEAALRLAGAGFGGGPMRLHLVQNIPFTPMVDAWNSGADEVTPMKRAEILERLAQTHTNVLANAHPPYAVKGGVRQILQESGGEMVAVDNDAVRHGQGLVAEALDLDPFPEGGAAMAGLVDAVKRGQIGPGERALVHITGAGWDASVKALGREAVPPDHVLGVDDDDGTARAIEAYLRRMDR